VPATAVAAPSPADSNAVKSAATTEPGSQGAGLGGGEPSAEAATYGDAARDAAGMPAIRLAEIGLAALVAILALVTIVARSRRPKGANDRKA
jgi:hypothetical protein